MGVPVFASVEEGLQGVDILVEYTSHATVREHTLTAVGRGIHVVVGSSGLTAEDFAEIDALARERRVGVIAAGNFSLTAAMAQAAALVAARHLPHWEVIDYADAEKPDVPSGTARELAERLGTTPSSPRSASTLRVGRKPVHVPELLSFRPAESAQFSPGVYMDVGDSSSRFAL